MAVKGSGELSMVNDIVAEFGGSAPHAMSEYYGGAGLVPAGANPNVPTSGEIRMNNFYNSVAATVLSITSNTNNYNIASAAQAAGGDLNTPVILTISPGVTVGSNSTGTAAMYTSTGWGSGTTINITNQGSIIGASGSNSSSKGSGGRGGNATHGCNFGGGSNGQAGGGANASGSNGGQAFVHSQPNANLSVIFDTAGTRTGGSAGSHYGQGGGGGGGAGAAWYTNGYSSRVNSGGGGGGGAGSPAGGGGSIGQTRGYQNENPACIGANSGNNGQSGSANSGGTGGFGDNPYGRGGTGGGLQSAGQQGQQGHPWASHRTSGGSAGAGGTNTGTAGQALGGNTTQIS